jgi:glycosyltransferase involved in cell wall biosynthesis
MMDDSPKVSFLIPTLNAAGILANCLQSIRRQEYPPEKIEIIVADGGSADATRELAAQHGARVLDNPRRGYDSGKSVALAAATGEFVVFVDADNELSHPDFLNLSIAALRRYPEALGLESYYLASPKMTSFCIYLSQLLHISDPIAWLMSVKPVRVAVDGAIERWTFPKDSFAWPMGSNGFVFRRSDLSGLSLNDQFEDCAVVVRIAQAGRREWLRVTNRGVHHYVANGLADFVRKRRRQTFHFLSLRGQGATSWTQMNPAVPAWLACLYCVSFLGPVYHALLGLLRTGNPAWLWHPAASLASVVGLTWGVLTHAWSGTNQETEANLQPRQKLRPSEIPPVRQKVFFISNGKYGDSVGGGDLHGYQMAEAALQAGYDARFIGGHALNEYLVKRGFNGAISLSDRKRLPPFDASTLAGQFRLLFDYWRRFFGTFLHLKQIQPEDYVHAVTDFWFDVIPAVICRARRKLSLLGMDAPTLGEILRQDRPDVTALRLPSLYFWASQNGSLRLLRRCANKRLLYVHPAMRQRLLRMGYRESEIIFGSNGMDVAAADHAATVEKTYDVVWIGRVHPQKGIDDLVATLAHLARALGDFRALMIGRVKEELAPKIEAAGISARVEFSGFVSEVDKFRLFKATRVFLMPSHYESWGLVIGEALACGVPVVAYDLAAYRPVFGDFLRYVPCFDLAGFQREAEAQVRKTRAGENYLDSLDLAGFKWANSWETVRAKFVEALQDLKLEH